MEKDYRNHTQEELLIKIRELEKEVKKLNNQIIKDDRYGLNWIDCPEAFEQETENKIPILEEVKDKAITNNDGKPTHILIEGDNYHALTCLNYTHKGKIDVIYIDPPYNTGNDGFTYKDKRFLKEYPDGQPVPKEHPLRHSYWLSFMNKRLKLAKELLSDNGVIFISIDDNEVAQLKLLCDGVFGESNFITNNIWKSKSGGAADAKFIATDTESILMYAKDTNKLSIAMDEEATVTTSYNREDENGKYALDRLDKQSLGYLESLDYPIKSPEGIFYYVEHKDINNKVARWRWSKETVKERYDELVFENGYVYTKNYEKEAVKPRNLLIEERFGRTRSGKTELFSIIGANSFPNPKPSKLLMYLLKLISDNNCIALDFFAGSGTTMQALLTLNNIDGGNRQCIICTNNENNICHEITYPRIQNIFNGYKSQGNLTNELMHEKINLTKFKKATKWIDKANAIKEKHREEYHKIKIEIKDGSLVVLGELSKNKEIEGLGNSLKYYKTSFVGKHSPKKATDDDRVELSYKAGYLLALSENTLEEIKKTDYYQIFENKDNATAIYFKEDLRGFDDFVKEVESLEKPTSVYIFSWDNAQGFEYNFEHIERVQIKSIPQAILEIYKSINQ